MIKILLEGDLHCGNHLGLTPPEHQGEWADILAPLWAWREAELKAIGPVDIHVLNGDLIDGPGRKDNLGLFTTDTKEQRRWAVQCIGRVKAKHRFFTYGTAYHVASTYEAERDIAEHFGTEAQDTVLLKAGGVRFNFRHHVGRSDVPAGFGAQDGKEITRALLQEVTDGYEAADIFARNHVHYWSRVDVKRRTAFTCPAWELNIDAPGSLYPRQLRTQWYDVGYVLIEIDSQGETYIRPRTMDLKIKYPREYACPILDAPIRAKRR